MAKIDQPIDDSINSSFDGLPIDDDGLSVSIDP